MKSSPAGVTVSVLLGVSVMVNVILLARVSTRSAPSRPPDAAARALPDAPAAPAVPDRPTGEEVVLSPPSPAPAPVPPAPPAARGGAAPAAPGRPLVDDPAVAAVIAAQEQYGAFSKDLDKVVKARSRLDEARYFDAVLAASADFLELDEPARSRLAQAARFAVEQLAVARREYETARGALPARDKNDPATYESFRQQRDTIDARYRDRVKAAVGDFRKCLDLARPRHAEFAAHAERWLRNLVPRSVP